MNDVLASERVHGANGATAPVALEPFEVECIDLFVRIAQFLGMPKSFGEIYGLVFLSPAPISMEELGERLNMSKGAVSQGVKQLKMLGAIKQVYVSGDRRDHYVIEQNIRQFVGGFLKERVEPALVDLERRLEQLEAKMEAMPAKQRKTYGERFAKVKTWQRKAQKFFPAIYRLLVG